MAAQSLCPLYHSLNADVNLICKSLRSSRENHQTLCAWRLQMMWNLEPTFTSHTGPRIRLGLPMIRACDIEPR